MLLTSHPYCWKLARDLLVNALQFIMHPYGLSPDLTIKVFSMLDTRSVFCAAATCSFFQKCAIDPLCYINIELGTLESKIKPNKDPKTKDAMVSTIIQRAGSAIQ
uniref:F-box domain-containing protein n=1 Tax=Lactuca sativa TaxID=4236 RepID=A0A9R1X2Q1_LACSA|nr:hypothetical protein LSAT_V11C700345130 [Lactuca sativa]